LIIPGFITDLMGALLFVPAARKWGVARLGHALQQRRRRARDGGATVVELDPGEWRQISESTIEDAPKRRPRLSRKRKP
jgi:UPF0716 family protein affecting phage T7 exclusion